MILAERAAVLESALRRLPSLLVALSGGVDSALLLAFAAHAMPGRVLAATTVSPAVPDEEVRQAAALASHVGVPHVCVTTHELEDPDYRANAGMRCYFCRREMYGRLWELARSEGIELVADGLLADDATDDRPGVRAAVEQSILHPLRDAGLEKAHVRRLAWGCGLEVHDKPAEPCLASRLPTGVTVTRERLDRVHVAERALRALGYPEVRVRGERTHGRIEVGPRELARAREEATRLVGAVLEAGFETASLDPRGYRTGGAG